MGISKAAYRLLLEEKKKGVLKGDSILQLGRQCVLFDQATLFKYAKKHQVLLEKIQPQLSFDSYYKKLKFIDDFTLFKSLGFHNVHSLDYSGFEGADMVFDLNHPLPEQYFGKFDVIYDGGTAEHVFHFPQLLKNIHLLLKEGGIIIHVSPSHNHVDHGFYMFSPQVFFEYYQSNGYEILNSQLIQYSPHYNQTWRIFRYEPGILANLCYGGFGKEMLAIHLIAKKKTTSTSGVIPQQGSYLQAWNAKKRECAIYRKKMNPLRRLGVSLQKKVKRRLPLFIKNQKERAKLDKVAKY